MIFLVVQTSLSWSLISDLSLCELSLCLAELYQWSVLRLFVLFRAHNGHRDGTDGMDYQTNPNEKQTHKKNLFLQECVHVCVCV